ncbi:MAG: DUF3179 domain-containing (seleno)protein, partial [Pseudomonadota bacterium]
MKKNLLILLAVCMVAFITAHAEPFFADQSDWPLTEFAQHTYPLAEFIDGGPGKDGIPALNQPQFDNIKQAEDWLDEREPVVVFTLNNQARAYPLQILMYHEIVNDVVDQQEIMVTYCPLCNAAMVFSRKLAGEVLQFGVSGKVHASNLVMFDRQTESWWLQFTGQAERKIEPWNQ